MAFLVDDLQRWDESPSRFDLEEGDTTIGRHPECTIVVDAGAVSRYHAKVVGTGNRFLVEDSGSRNGTFLNGQLLTGPEQLREGDRIRGSARSSSSFATRRFPNSPVMAAAR